MVNRVSVIPVLFCRHRSASFTVGTKSRAPMRATSEKKLRGRRSADDMTGRDQVRTDAKSSLRSSLKMIEAFQAWSPAFEVKAWTRTPLRPRLH